MSVSRSEQFVYFQNKARHYHQLRNMRSSIDHGSPRSRMPRTKPYKRIPLLSQHKMEVENELLIDRLVRIAGSQRIEIAADGGYSRYNKVERPFREQSPFRAQKERAITLDNSDRKLRITKMKPAIGTNAFWNKEYSKSIFNKNNLSKYHPNNSSKDQLHLSTNQFMPQHLLDYGLREPANASITTH